MLEKSLPFFRKDPQNQDQKTLQTSNSGGSLSFHEQIKSYNEANLGIFIKLFIRLYFATTTAFLIMLFLNWVLDVKLTSQKIMLNNLSDQVSKLSTVRAEAEELDKRITFYDNTLSARNLLGDKARVIFENLNNTIDLESANIKSDIFSLDFKVATPLDFAKLTARYLDSPLISSITLRSADLVTSRGYYQVIIEGKYAE